MAVVVRARTFREPSGSSGTPSVLAMSALECGVDVFAATAAAGGMAALRRKSEQLTGYLDAVHAQTLRWVKGLQPDERQTVLLSAGATGRIERGGFDDTTASASARIRCCGRRRGSCASPPRSRRWPTIGSRRRWCPRRNRRVPFCPLR